MAVVACGGLRKRHERVELGAGGARVDGFGGKAHAIEKIRGAACSNEGAGCICEDDIAVRTVLVGPRSVA